MINRKKDKLEFKVAVETKWKKKNFMEADPAFHFYSSSDDWDGGRDEFKRRDHNTLLLIWPI